MRSISKVKIFMKNLTLNSQENLFPLQLLLKTWLFTQGTPLASRLLSKDCLSITIWMFVPIPAPLNFITKPLKKHYDIGFSHFVRKRNIAECATWSGISPDHTRLKYERSRANMTFIKPPFPPPCLLLWWMVLPLFIKEAGRRRIIFCIIISHSKLAAGNSRNETFTRFVSKFGISSCAVAE